MAVWYDEIPAKFKCFACGEGGNLWSLVNSYAIFSKDDALKKYSFTLQESDQPSLAMVLESKFAGMESWGVAKGVSKLPTYSKPDEFSPWHRHTRASEYLLGERRISPDVLNRFSIMYDLRRDRVAFPVVDFGNPEALVGAVGRALGDGPKYFNYWNFEASRTIGGWTPAVENATHVVLVEGYFDVLNFSSQIDDDKYVALCTWHAELSRDQANVLLALDKTILICYDADSAGNAGARKALDLLSPQGYGLKRKAPITGHDYGSMNRVQILHCLED